jgi:hypothetical protein
LAKILFANPAGPAAPHAGQRHPFSSVKSEVADRFDSSGEAKMKLFDYIEVFSNQRRRHSTLGQISPAAFERHAIPHAARMNREPDRAHRAPRR